MTLRQLLIRFTVIYIAAMVLLAIVFALLDIDGSNSNNTAALVAATFLACSTFCEKNGRRLNADETRRAWIGMLVIDLGLQAVGVSLMSLGGMAPPLFSGAMLLAFAFVGLLHALGILGMVKYSGHLYDKQQAAKARKAEKAEKRLRAERRPPSTISSAPMHDYPNTVPMDLR